MFSTGLESILDQMDKEAESRGTYGDDTFKNMIFKLEKDYKYKCRILTEQEQFLVFEEYSFVPVDFHTKSGEKKPGWLTFFATDDSLQGKKVMDKKGERVIRKRKVLAIPLFVKEAKLPNKKNSKNPVEDIEQLKIMILPPGKEQANWRMLLESAAVDDDNTLMNKYFQIMKSGEGTSTTWSIVPMAPSEFEYKDEIEMPNIEEVVKKSGFWKNVAELERCPLRGEIKEGSSSSDDDNDFMSDDEDDVANKL